MRSWAFATSPHGLGLSGARSWELTPREHAALVDVHKQTVTRWARARAQFANAHFRGENDVPFLADDFTGEGDREARQAEMQRSLLAAARANASLAQMKRGDKPEGLPSWALGD